MRSTGSATLTLVPLEATARLQAKPLQIVDQIQPEGVLSLRERDLEPFEEPLPGLEETVITPPIHVLTDVHVGHPQELLFRQIGLLGGEEDLIGLHEPQPPLVRGAELGPRGNHEDLVSLGQGLLELSARVVGALLAVGIGESGTGLLVLGAGGGLENVASGKHRNQTVVHEFPLLGKRL